jgi:uncharacterized protein involved in exopolysaccharide biosynthesis
MRADATASGEDLLGYMRMIWSRRLVVLAVLVIALTAATVYCLRATPAYEARAQLLISPEGPNVVDFKEVIEEQAGKTDYYLTQLQILQSRDLARATLEALRLWTNPEFTADPDRFAWIRPLLGGGFRVAEPPPADREGNATVAQLQAIGRFLERLTIEPIRNSRLVNVRFRSADPGLSANVVNTLVRLYIERSMDLKPAASKEALAWLDGQVAKQRQAVAKQEVALQRFRDANDTLVLDGQQSVVVQSLADLNAAVTRARTARIQKESLYEQLQAAGPDGTTLPAAGTLGPVAEDLRASLAKLQLDEAQLAARLGDRHPDLVAARAAVRDMEARLNAEVERHRESVHRDLLAARANEQRLTEAFEAKKQEVLALDRKALAYGELQRDVASSRQVLESLLQRSKQMEVAGNLKTSNVRVVDSASIPLSTVFPRKQVVLGVAGFVGLGLGLIAALALAYTDTRITSAEQVRRQLDLQFLGYAPLLPRRALTNGPLVVNNGVPSDFAEALRMVRTNIAVDREAAGPRVLLVTSARKGEGKTLIAINLARPAAGIARRRRHAAATGARRLRSAARAWSGGLPRRRGRCRCSGSGQQHQGAVDPASRHPERKPGGPARLRSRHPDCRCAWTRVRLDRDRLAAGRRGHRRVSLRARRRPRRVRAGSGARVARRREGCRGPARRRGRDVCRGSPEPRQRGHQQILRTPRRLNSPARFQCRSPRLPSCRPTQRPRQSMPRCGTTTTP